MPDEVNITIKTTDKSGRVLANLSKRVRETRVSFKGLALAARNLGRIFAGPFLRAAGRAIAKLKALGRELLTVSGFARRVGGLMRGVLTAGMMAVVGGAFALAGAFGAMREAMEGGEEATGGAGGAAEDAAEKMEGLAAGAAQAAETSEKAAEKIKGVFGAFGQVGAGFIQEQGKILEQTAAQADEAVRTAKDAAAAAKDTAEAMEAAGGSIDDATQSTTRFGKALDRIGSVFDKAKTKILKAIAKAITPALEKFADLLESPVFEKFVDLLAKDLAKAAEKVAKWIVNKVIPAVMRLMKKINAAGGPVAYLKEKFEELKIKALMVLAIILGKALEWSNTLRGYATAVGTAWGLLGDAMELAITTALSVAAAAARGTINGIISLFETGINGIIAGINTLIGLYNKVAEAIGAATIGEIGDVSLPRVGGSGGVEQSTGAGGDIIISVTVPIGTADPYSFGDGVGQSIVTAMRREGLRMPI